MYDIRTYVPLLLVLCDKMERSELPGNTFYLNLNEFNNQN